VTKATIPQPLKDMITNAVQSAVNSVEMWDEMDKYLQEDLEKSYCSISFHEGKTRAFIGLGTGDVAHELDVELDWAAYDEHGGLPKYHVPSPAQIEDIYEQIAGIDKFIGELTKLRKLLADRVPARKIN
jgi:hypothetical protein